MDTKINAEYSFEILKEIVEYMNKTTDKIDFVESKINSICDSQTWDCVSAEEFKSKCLNILLQFKKECAVTNQYILQLVEILYKYQELDKKIIQNFCGDISV